MGSISSRQCRSTCVSDTPGHSCLHHFAPRMTYIPNWHTFLRQSQGTQLTWLLFCFRLVTHSLAQLVDTVGIKICTYHLLTVPVCLVSMPIMPVTASDVFRLIKHYFYGMQITLCKWKVCCSSLELVKGVTWPKS